MVLPDIRQRAGHLFLVLAVGHIILISAQVNTKEGFSVLRVVVFSVFSEVQWVTSRVIGGVELVWTRYGALWNAQRENVELRRQVAALQVKVQEQRALAEKSARLEALLEMRGQSKLGTTGADVIGATTTRDSRMVTIDKGSQQGLKTDMAVLVPSGVVGRVATLGLYTANVQLLPDRNAAVGVVVARSRAPGVVVGTGEDWLRLQYVSSTANIKVGDIVVTSGDEGIYPKGFVVGQVERIETSGGADKTIRVRPAVDFRALEEVLVVTVGADLVAREAVKEAAKAARERAK